MPKITYVDPFTGPIVVEAAAQSSLMRAAVDNNVQGILGECGGALSCATCHVYIAEEHLARLPQPHPLESEMLSFTAAERRPNSRLACQVIVDAGLDGLVVHLPEIQR